MKKTVYVIGYDPIKDMAGVGGFDWFYNHKTCMRRLKEHCQFNTHLVWFRAHNVKVTGNLGNDNPLITDNIVDNIVNNGIDGDWK